MSTTLTPEIPAPEPRSRRQRTRLILLVVVPLVAAAIALGFYLKGGRYVSTDNAYVKADKVPVSTEVSGAVKDVLVHENQTVNAGQILFRLDPVPFQVAVAKAEAKLAQVRTDLSALQASYREKQAEISIARTRLGFAALLGTCVAVKTAVSAWLHVTTGMVSLEHAPGFNKGDWPDMADVRWGTQIFSHYGYRPYWE